MHKKEFQSSGSSPSVDFTIRDEGSVLLLTRTLTLPAIGFMNTSALAMVTSLGIRLS